VIRQLMTESLLLAGIGCGLSLLIAPVLPPLVMRLRNQSPPPPLGLIPDAPVLAFALTISVLAAIAFGIAPALRTTRIPIIETLKTYGSRASARFPLEGVLVAVQVCISVALLLGAGLLLRGVTQARALDPGFRTEGLSALSVQLPRSAYGTPQERAFFDQLHSSLEASGQPIAMTAVLPLGDTRNFTDFNVAGVPAEARSPVAVEDVTTGYFPLLEMPIVAGRGFRADDRARGAIVINESLARRYWPDGNAIGQTVTIGDRPREIIGIVRNAQMHDIGRNEPIYFAPFSANSQGVGAAPVILVPTTAVARVTSIVRGEEPNAIVDLVSLSEQAEQSLGDAKGSARMASLLAWLALLLATCGVYGIISYSVERRRKEIMIRIALGARPRAVIGLVLQRNARPLLIGALLGVVVSVGEAVVLRSQLYGLNPLDPVVLAGVSAVLVVAGIAAAALPTRRAIRTDPVVALHEH
jgi:putative ABC transport system permease protein